MNYIFYTRTMWLINKCTKYFLLHTELSGKGINLKGFHHDLSLIKMLCVHITNLCSLINLSLVFCTMHGPHKKSRTCSIATVNLLLTYHE